MLGHRWLGDRERDAHEFVSTAGFRGLGAEAFDDPDRSMAYGYRATPRALVSWVLDELDPDYARTSFVDLGSGRGRVVLEAARRPFLRCLGIEISPSLHEDAEQNLRHWPRSLMACRDVDYVCDSILRASLPEGPLLIWMFNPATDRLILRLAARLAERAAAGQPITLVYVDPRHDMPFRQAPSFRARRIRDRRVRFLSPYGVGIWHSGPQFSPQS
ncbi:MAG: class I SAM-dependent methyltransferase [Flavobacteriaceae bacterium]